MSTVRPAAPPDLVRRLDWRFLLPDSRLGPGVRVVHAATEEGSAPGTLLEALRASGAEVVASPPAESCGLAVVEGADPALVRRVRPALAAGGALYWEMPRGGPTAARLELVLDGAGLDPRGRYWHHPGFEECRWLVPLDDAGALRYFFSRGEGVAARFAGWIPGPVALRVAPFLAASVSVVAQARGRTAGGTP